MKSILKINDLPRRLFLLSLVLLAIGLPASKFLMSLGQFGLLLAWLVKGNYKQSVKQFFTNPALVVLSSLWILHLLGLFYTDNFSYALRDIRIKLPILVLPFFSAPFLPLKRKEQLWVFHFFVATVLVVSCIGFYRKITAPELPFSPFISHIRYSLMVVFSMFITVYFIQQKLVYKAVYVAVLVWLAITLYFLGSLTGMVVLVLSLAFTVMFLPANRFKWIKWLLASGIVVAAVIIFYTHYYLPYQQQNIPKEKPVLEYSASGEKYYSDFSFDKGVNRENGYYIWQNIAWNELRESWQKVSQVPFDDSSLNAVKYTLVRYMTSLGLDKDAENFKKLSDDDIRAIERGIANYRLKEMNKFERRMYQTLWEIEVWKKHGDPSGHSLVMRFIYWQSAINVWKQHPVLGVGTGDVFDEVKRWQQNHSLLEEPFFAHPHNQFLSILVAFGISGFIWFVIWIFYPVIKMKSYHWVSLSFWAITIFSYLNEDTLETQAGVTFVMFFSTIIYSSKKVY